MENMVMGIAFGTAVANLYGWHIVDYKGQYNYITMQDIEDETPVVFPTAHKRNCIASTENFAKIPGSPVAYWVSDNMLKAFKTGKLLTEVAEPKQGLKTGDNDTFLRMWYEVAFTKSTVGKGAKWFPCNKGGEYRRWYGNNDYFIDWENDGYKLKIFRHPDGRQKSRPQNLSYMGKEGLTYTNISSSNFSIRYSPKGTLFDAAGSMIFTKSDELHYMLGLLSSQVVAYMTKFLSATMSFEVGQLSNLGVHDNFVSYYCTQQFFMLFWM